MFVIIKRMTLLVLIATLATTLTIVPVAAEEPLTYEDCIVETAVDVPVEEMGEILSVDQDFTIPVVPDADMESETEAETGTFEESVTAEELDKCDDLNRDFDFVTESLEDAEKESDPIEEPDMNEPVAESAEDAVLVEEMAEESGRVEIPAVVEEMIVIDEADIVAAPESIPEPEVTAETILAFPVEEMIEGAEEEPVSEEAVEEEFIEISEEFFDSLQAYEYMWQDPEELLSEYIGLGNETAGYTIEALYASSYNGNKLNGPNKAVYDGLKSMVVNVASGATTSTQYTSADFGIDFSEYKFTAADLGVDSLTYKDSDGKYHVTDAAGNKAKDIVKKAKIDPVYDTSLVVKSLIRDCPCELFWFGNNYTFSIKYIVKVEQDTKKGELVLTITSAYVQIAMSVSLDYRGANVYLTDSSKINAINSTINMVNSIVYSASGMDDLSKLNYYRQRICELVSYDHTITSSNYPGGYGNPWQIIYVFDGDTSTNVVCEGYAKAFQYLCDQSNFTGTVQAVYSVSGTFQAGSGSVGGHLWNIVCLSDGKNYMVDLTNSDGYSGNNRLYMVQPQSGNVDNGYEFVINGTTYRYKYYDDTRMIYSDFELALSPVHEWDAGKITSTPTCSSRGIKTYTCTICGETKTEEYGTKLAHTPVTQPAEEATLFKEGKTEGTVCSVCKTVITASKVVPMKELTRVLVKGMKGEDVRQVQQKLYELGYLPVAPDGIYGNYTVNAVNAYQKDRGLANPDGMVGNWTISKLRGEASGGSSSTDILVYTRTLVVGMRGPDVMAVQKRLKELGYLTVTPDGIYGNYTKAAVNDFQLANGLGYCDGMVGKWTISKLNNNPISKKDAPSNSSKITISQTLKVGMKGSEVLAVQKRLAELGYLTVTPDGIYGNYTKAAVDDFQLANGLGYCDGMVGNWTVGKLNGNPVAKK